MAGRKLLVAVVLLALGFLITLSSGGGVTEENWTIFCAGKGDPTGAWEILAFFPSHLTINAGDNVTFICFHIHTVTFGNYTLVPPVLPPGAKYFSPQYSPYGSLTITSPDIVSSSGLLIGPANVTFFFPNPGKYPFQCILHGTMTGSITVQPTGSTLPLTPAEVVLNGTTALQHIVAQIPAVTAAGQLNRTTAPSSVNASGKKTWIVLVGGGSATFDLTYARFIPSQLTINVGDTVAFQMNDFIDIHTVAFNTSCVYNDDDTTINATTVLANPNYWVGNGVNTAYPTLNNNGYAFIASGVLPPAPGFFFNVTFTQPGTYCYICHLHRVFGMAGNVTVVAPTSSSPASTLSPFGFLRSLFFF